MEERLLTVTQVAERLGGISETQVRRLVQWGHLRQGRRVAPGIVRWFDSDVLEYLTKLKYDALPPIPRKPKRPKGDKPAGN